MLFSDKVQAAQNTTGSPMFTWLILGLFFVVAIVFMSRSGKKRVAQMEKQRQEMKDSLKEGTWVRMTSGFFGKVVEVGGDVVTLANLTGEETLWDVRAIAEIKEPNFGSVAESSAANEPGDDSPQDSSNAKPELDSESTTYGTNMEEESGEEKRHGDDLHENENPHKF